MARRFQWPCWLLDLAWDWQATPHPADRRFSNRVQRALKGMRRAEWWRWKLWGLVTRLPSVCPANAHEVIVSNAPDRRRSPFADRACRDMANGSCYCGKLRAPGDDDA